MFPVPKGDDKSQIGGVQAPQRQSTILDPKSFGSPLSAGSPLDTPLNSTSPRMTLSPQQSMVIDPSAMALNGTLPMNNYVLTGGIPQSPSFALQTSPTLQPNPSILLANPMQNNAAQVQALQLQIQQMQLQMQMLQQQQPQAGAVNPQLQQMQMQLQMMQQQQLQNQMGSLSINPTDPKLAPAVGAPKSSTDKYGVVSSYATPNLLPQMEVLKIVENIKEAINSINMDPGRLINIIGKYPPNQMNQIINNYKTMYKQNLESVVKNATSGNFGKLCVALTKTALDYDAWLVYDAIKGLGTDDDCLIDVLVGRTNVDMIALNKVYKETYNKTLEDDVKGDTSGDYRTTLISLLQGNRNETNIQRDVETDVDALYKAGEGKVGTNESTFINIFTSRSYAHLRTVFDQYQQKYSHSMEKVIGSEFSGNIKKTLISIVKYVNNPSEFIAEQFENSMKGMGTKNDKLIRLAVRYREPLFMKKVKADYVKLYGKSLAKRIEGETSGDYRKLLLTVIGEL